MDTEVKMTALGCAGMLIAIIEWGLVALSVAVFFVWQAHKELVWITAPIYTVFFIIWTIKVKRVIRGEMANMMNEK